MSKVAHYLQEHLVGEVMTSTDARRYFSTDSSILQIAPALIVYPRNENDVRKTARFTWQLAERGRVIPVTARGLGTDQSGSALGSGIMVVFPAHMNRILELDTKANTVTVEPGINYAKLQQTLHTHGRFLPPFPSSIEYSTIGGAVSNNASGEKSIKYGSTRSYVKALRVVLANGEVIVTGRLNKRELNKKLGLATFEGEIYRSIDALLEENRKLIGDMELNVTKNNAGYDLLDIKRKDGSFDLTPLFVGSQGTLGIITEIVLETEAHNPQTSLTLATFDSLENLQNAILDLRDLPETPSALELIDGKVLQQVHSLNPNFLKGVIDEPFPAAALLIEFDCGEKRIKKIAKKVGKILDNFSTSEQTETEPDKQQKLWKLRQATGSLMSQNEGLLRSVPIIDDATVPPTQIRSYIEGAYKLLKSNGVKPAVWGHAGDGTLRMQPKLNLGQVGDRQRAFRLISEHAKLVKSLGGTISSEAGDGRLRTPYLENIYGPEVYTLLKRVKQIFDPYDTLNSGVKFGTSEDDLKEIIRTDFSFEHIYDHLPRS